MIARTTAPLASAVPAGALPLILAHLRSSFNAASKDGPGHGFAPRDGSGQSPWAQAGRSAEVSEPADPGPRTRTAEEESAELDAALASARADGFAAGVDEGERHAHAAHGIALDELRTLSAALADARAFDPAELAGELATTIVALLAALLEEEPALATLGLETRIERALVLLAARSTPATLWLAPADAAALAPTLARADLSIVPDPTLAHGALRVTTRESRVDDSIAERLARLAPLLDQRAAHG